MLKVKTDKKCPAATKDEKQMNISTFFQSKPDNQKGTQSKLFTNVGSCKPQKQSFTCVKTQPSHVTANISESQIKDFSLDTNADIENLDSGQKLKRKNLCSGDIANTQVVLLPQVRTPLKPLCVHYDDKERSPDITIPDTPESLLLNGKERKKFKSNRSFLKSVSLLGERHKAKLFQTKGIKNQKSHLKTNKSLVSVEFKTNSHHVDVIEQREHLMNPSEETRDAFNCEESIGDDLSRGDENTPTKCYNSFKGHSKRLAKPGSSPSAKRALNESNSHKCLQTTKTEVVKSQVKRVLCLMGAQDAEADKYNATLLDYQLGVTKMKKDVMKDLDENDEFLSEILNEMRSESKTNTNSVSTTRNPVTNLNSLPDRQQIVKTMDVHGTVDKEVSSTNALSTDVLGNGDYCRNGTPSERSDQAELMSRGFCDGNFKKDEKSPFVTKNIVYNSLNLNTKEAVKEISHNDPALFEDDIFLDMLDLENKDTSLKTKKSEPVLFELCKSLTDSNLDDVSENQLLCEEFDDFSSFEMTQIQTENVRPADRFGRYKVIHVEYAGQDLILDLQSDVSDVKRTCILQGFWADSKVEVNDVVNVHGEFNEESRCYISDESGLIIIRPDALVSGTSVVSSVHCMRRSVLSEKFKGCDDKNIHMLFGSVIHTVFQEVLKNCVSSESDIMKITTSVMQLSKFLHEMYSQNVSEAVVLEEIKKYIPPLQKWLHLTSALNTETSRNRLNDVQICRIKDIEENIWSPRFGIKGKIDLTVEVKIQREKGHIEKKIIPLELKTGKTTYSIEHKGQVTLYSMMSSDRREDPQEGLLLYLKDPDMKLIPVKQENKRGLIQLRNEIAYYLSQQVTTSSSGDGLTYEFGQLPRPINNSRTCARCPQLLNCTAYQRNLEELNLDKTHAMSSLVDSTLSHLSENHLEYFFHWCLCLDLESRDGQQTNIKDIWCKSSTDREIEGDCLSGMVITNTEVGLITDSQFYSEGTSYLITFSRLAQYNSLSDSLVNAVGLTVNDNITISTDDGKLLVLCTGVIKQISEHTVQVVVDRDNFHCDKELQSQVFRLDRCDNFSTLGYLYTNLSKLMTSDQHRHRLRELIIDKKKPEFQFTLSKGMLEKVKPIFKLLNTLQKTVILKVLMCKDYVLIRGYPGTGKTSMIIALVKILYLLGQSVLLTSYTHSAVDNILLKLKQDDIPFLRLGRLSRIHKAIHPYAAETLTSNITSVSELRDFYSSQKIVATSCLGTNHCLFSQMKFDICVVDEASQVLLPACLGPLFSSQRFVLVGDPLQLPPVVQSRDARNLGMSESLFVHLDDTGATFDLSIQYRMNRTIMQLANELVYDGALKCANKEVAESSLSFSHTELLEKQAVWIQIALSPAVEKSAVFLNTKQVPAPETTDRTGQVKNETEAAIVMSLLKTLLLMGKDAGSVGIIAPYRKQVNFIHQSLLKEGLPAVEVNTVDQYQGRDKDVIIISFVRSQCDQGSNRAGELLKDMRRLNVSITRARHKLILLGDLRTLQQYEPLNKLINIMTENHQIVELPEKAHL